MTERRLSRTVPARTVGLVVAAVALLAACQPKPADPLPIGGIDDALAAYVASPNAVPGANDWSCKPSSAHPTPVVLVHATGVNLGANWVALSPMLKNAGYCVYAFNYGMTALSLGRFGGLGDIAASAGTLRDFVEKVRTSTGAAKVDLVGHSQGGMMPSYYLKNLGGAAKVRVFVGLSPSNHGTSLSGIVALGADLNVLGFTNSLLWGLGIPGLAQQEAGSSFQKALFGGGDTVPGPRYVVIQTKYDHVVTPYTNAFLSGATNILVQDQCPNDKVGHIGMFADRVVLANVLNQLGAADPAFKAACTGYGVPL
jgi:triacylglycerol esterase/lipase EstA (alpha/beta hydrolase family)